MFLNKKKANKVKTNESKAAMRKQIMMQIIFIFVAILFVFATPAGLGIYGIINSTLQIIQTICFHYYNKYKKNKDKNEGIIQEPLIKKIKNIFKPRARNYQQNKK